MGLEDHVSALAAPSIETRFYIEQAALASVAVLFMLLFLVQIMTEKKGGKNGNPLPSNTVPYKYHRAGLITCLVMLTVAYDPYGRHERFGPATPSFLVAEVSAVLLYCYLAFAEAVMELKFKTSFVPVPKKFQGRASVFFGMVGIILANVVYGLAVSLNRWWWTAIFTLWAAAMFLASACAILVLSLLVVNKLKKVAAANEEEDADDAARAEAQKIRRAAASVKRWGWVFFYYGLAMFVIYTRETFVRFEDREAPIYQPDLERLGWQDRLVPYSLWFGIMLIFAYGWVTPVQQHKAHFEEQSDAPEEEKQQVQYTGQYQGQATGGVAGLLGQHQKAPKDEPDWMAAVQPQRPAQEYEVEDSQYQADQYQGDQGDQYQEQWDGGAGDDGQWQEEYGDAGYAQYEDPEAADHAAQESLLPAGVLQAGDPEAQMDNPQF